VEVVLGCWGLRLTLILLTLLLGAQPLSARQGNASWGSSLSGGSLYRSVRVFSQHQASGDIRPNGDRYVYHIQLSGITNTSLSTCKGANICQVRLNGDYQRKIGSSSKALYYMKGTGRAGYNIHTVVVRLHLPPTQEPCPTLCCDLQGPTWT